MPQPGMPEKTVGSESDPSFQWTPAWAWWLGATFGDGHSDNRKGRRSVVLVSGDRDLVEKWSAIGGGSVSAKGSYWKAVKNSVVLTELLASFGMAGRKGSSLRWPTDLPAALEIDFVRGLWDTDGSVEWYRGGGKHREGRTDSMRGTFCNKSDALVRSMVERFPTLSHEHQTVRRGQYAGNTYALATARGDKAISFAASLYKDSPPHLRCERKFQIWASFDNWQSSNTHLCDLCGAQVVAHTRCRGCRKRKTIGLTPCAACGESKNILAKGLCRPCYHRSWRKASQEKTWNDAGADLQWLERFGAIPERDVPDAAVEEALAIYRKRGFPWFVLNTDHKTTLQDVQKGRLTVDESTRTIRSVGWSGQPQCTDHHRHRMQAHYRGKKSAVAAFDDDLALRRAIRFQLKVGDPITPKRVLRAICATQKVPTNFPPVLARWIVDRYAPLGGVVIDPCAGYGGRLLGALSSEKNVRYKGFDIEVATVAANCALLHTVGAEGRASCTQADLLAGDTWEQADLLLTGPPYFDCENYGSASQGSVQQDYLPWVESFMGALFKRAKLIPMVVLNVGPFHLRGKVIDYPADTLRIASACGFSLREHWFWQQASFGKGGRKESILVFERVDFTCAPRDDSGRSKL